MLSENKTYHNPKCYCIVSRNLIKDPYDKRKTILAHNMILTKGNKWTSDFFSKNLLTFTTKTECIKYIKGLDFNQHKIHLRNGLECDYLIPVLFKNIKLLRLKFNNDPLRWESPYTKEIIESIDAAEKVLKKKKLLHQNLLLTINDIRTKLVAINPKDKNPILNDITPATYQYKRKEEKKLSLEELKRKPEERKFFLIDSQTKEYLCGFNNMIPYFSKDINDSMYFLRLGEVQFLLNKLRDMSYYEFLKNLNLIIVDETGKQVHLPKTNI